MKFNDFGYAEFLAHSMYGIDLLPEDFEELGLIAFNLIGNKRYRLYRAQLNVVNNTAQLPCNCDVIEAVTYGFEDWNWVSNIYPNGDFSSQFTESYIEGRKLFHDPFYLEGKFVKYTRVGNTIYLDKDYGGTLQILYKGEIVDDNGLPQITDKEALAIATYCAYITKYKEGLITNNGNILQLAQALEVKWNRQCDQARVPDEMSQNEFDEILDAKTSWNRKIHNKSYKITL